MRKYGNVEYWLHLPVEKFEELYKLALEKEREDRIRSQWVAMLPLMSIGYLKYMPFEDYYDQCTGRNVDTRPAEEIIAEIKGAHGRG